MLLAACGTAPASSPGKSTGKTTANLGITAPNGQVEVNLPLNQVVFGDAGTPTPNKTGFGGGYTLDAATTAKPGPLNTTIGGVPVTFNVPQLGDSHKSAVQIKVGDPDITVRVPAGTYKEMYLVEGAGDGPGTVDITPLYSDGSKGTARTVTIDDWCVLAVNNTPTPGSVPVLMAQKRLDPTGTETGPAGCGMEGIGVPLNPAKTMSGFTLGNVATTTLGLKNDPAQQTDLTVNIAAVTLAPGS